PQMRQPFACRHKCLAVLQLLVEDEQRVVPARRKFPLHRKELRQVIQVLNVEDDLHVTSPRRRYRRRIFRRRKKLSGFRLSCAAWPSRMKASTASSTRRLEWPSR